MSEALLAVEELEKHYPIREGLFRRQVGTVQAVDGISFSVAAGETVGLIGESGCGKSTAATSILRLEEPTDGSVTFDGDRLGEYDNTELREFRRRASMVFQNPTDSFDPKMTIGESVAEPLRVQGLTDQETIRSVVTDLIERCGLARSAADRYPHELSDGMKQRAALARALAVNPDLLVADEPVSALDVSIQAEIIALLDELQSDLGLSMLVISHDMGVVRELCDRVCVMYLGEIVERGPTEALFSDPDHPYTQALVRAVAKPDPRAAEEREPLGGEIPDASSPPTGCRFHPRCPSIIPPEEFEIDSETYQGIVQLRSTLANGEIDQETLAKFRRERSGRPPGTADVEDAGATPMATQNGGERVRDDGELEAVRRGLRRRHDIPPELSDPEAENALAAAIDSVIAGSPAEGAQQLSETFESVCEGVTPSLQQTEAERAVSCHLHHDPRE